jgi:deoxyribodipyrimidine photolyase-like uncharacterized protein
MSPTPVCWLFGDQLGPHFLGDHDGPVLMVEPRAVFRRRRFHRAKAQLVLSVTRHRAAGQFEEPSAALAVDKSEFGSSRIKRWFGRDWSAH